MKRIKDRDLVAYDAKHGTSLRRELEMAVDQALSHGFSDYSIQFWKDVDLYGVREACQYLGNSGFVNDGTWKPVVDVREKIETAFHGKDSGGKIAVETD